VPDTRCCGRGGLTPPAMGASARSNRRLRRGASYGGPYGIVVERCIVWRREWANQSPARIPVCPAAHMLKVLRDSRLRSNASNGSDLPDSPEVGQDRRMMSPHPGPRTATSATVHLAAQVGPEKIRDEFNTARFPLGCHHSDLI
jgi:hypothetical protein